MQKQIELEKQDWMEIVSMLGTLILAWNIVLLLIPLAFFNFPILFLIFLLSRYTSCGQKNYKMIVSDNIEQYICKLKYSLVNGIYNLVINQYPELDYKCMNCGHALLTSNGYYNINLHNQYEFQRFQYQLYDYTVSGLKNIKSLKNKRVLDIGSGRGGGIDFISKYKNPQYCLGIDLSEKQVQYAESAFKTNRNIDFKVADAHSFYDNLIKKHDIQLFDIVICVESSHLFQFMEKFMQQVSNSLKEGGYFCIAAFVPINQIPQYEQQLKSTNLQSFINILHIYQFHQYFQKLIEKEDITVTVLHAMRLDEHKKRESIDQQVNFLVRKYIWKLIYSQKDGLYQQFNRKQLKYFIHLFRKQKNDSV